MDIISRWHEAHPTGFELTLFLLACLVSVFSSAILGFLKSFPRKQRAVRYRKDVYRIQLLNLLHNDSYQLLLYVLSEVVWGVTTALLWSLFLIAFQLGLAHKIDSSSLGSITVGILLGKAIQMRSVLAQLHNYEDSIEKLKQRQLKHQKGEQTKTLQAGN